MRIANGFMCGLGVWFALAGAAAGQPGPKGDLGSGLAAAGGDAAPVLRVEPVAEKAVERLPRGPLYWRVQRFRTLAEAQAVEGPWSLAAEAWNQAWLFTLGARAGGVKAADYEVEVGPVPVPAARRVLLRINRAGGPPGARTPVHTHPGSEAFYVLRGQLTQTTDHGVLRVDAGRVLNGHQPGMAMQLTSSGAESLEQLVMFVVDADKAFSSPAKFESR